MHTHVLVHIHTLSGGVTHVLEVVDELAHLVLSVACDVAEQSVRQRAVEFPVCVYSESIRVSE